MNVATSASSAFLTVLASGVTLTETGVPVVVFDSVSVIPGNASAIVFDDLVTLTPSMVRLASTAADFCSRFFPLPTAAAGS